MLLWQRPGVFRALELNEKKRIIPWHSWDYAYPFRFPIKPLQRFRRAYQLCNTRDWFFPPPNPLEGNQWGRERREIFWRGIPAVTGRGVSGERFLFLSFYFFLMTQPVPPKDELYTRQVRFDLGTAGYLLLLFNFGTTNAYQPTRHAKRQRKRDSRIAGVYYFS